MVMPAIDLSRYQVADLFSEVTKKKQEVDIEKLVKVARRELRPDSPRRTWAYPGPTWP